MQGFLDLGGQTRAVEAKSPLELRPAGGT
jgi:hypothetical protein